jgi:hypothetical protein
VRLNERVDRWLPWALVLFAGVVRALRWAQTAVMMNDGPTFLRLAGYASNGDFTSLLRHPFHPLYSLAIAAATPLFGDPERAAVAVSIAAGALAVGALWALLRAAFDAKVAGIGAFLLAVHPSALELADLQSDGLYLALFLASAALLWRAYAAASARVAFAAGLVAGFAYLTRPEGLGTLVVGAALAALEVARRHWNVSQAARFSGALLLGGVLVMSPYVAFLSARAGGLVLTGKKSVTGVLGLSAVRAWLTTGSPEYQPPKPLDPLLAARPDLVRPEKGVKPFRVAPVKHGFSKYPDALVRLGRSTRKALRPEILALLALGLWSARGRPGPRGRFIGTYVALYAFVLFGLAANSGYVSRRHVLPPAALTFGYAALGVAALADGLGRLPGLGARLAPSARLALPLVLVAGLGLGKALRPDRLNALPELHAAEWVREQGGLAPDQAVAAIKQRVGYYANARFVDLRRAPHEALLLAFLRRERARYVVVDESERAELLRMLGPDAAALAPVHEERAGEDVAFVFEVRG